MRKYLLAAVAAAAITSPAMARDGAGYVGIDLGAMLVEDLPIDIETAAGVPFADYAIGDHKIGYDAGVTAGYDFGAVRAEAEVAYKRASHDEYVVNGATVNADGRSTSMSIMGNLLLDFGDDDGWQGFVGGGVGLARTRVALETTGLSARRISDSGFAWQLLAGIRYPVSDNIDFGLKYRFYNHDISDDLTFAPLTTVGGEADARFRSHSLLASLVFNFGSAPPPPPPPPPAPERG
jgi:opacity protein-like surface antigen